MNRFRILLNHYLLIASTVAFASGILLHHLLPLPPYIALISSASLLCATLFLWRSKAGLSSMTLLLLSVAALGFLHTVNSESQVHTETHIHSRISQEEDAVLTGTLHRMVQFDGEKSTVIIKSHSLRRKQDEHFLETHGLVRLRLKGPWPDSFLPGNELVIRCTLSRPYRFGNPGSFDYPAFLAASDIRVVGKISSTVHIHKLAGQVSRFHSLRYLPERIRLSLGERIDSTLPPREAGIYRALLIGDRSGVDRASLEAFKAAGVFHILAISGLHLSLVASTLFFLFLWLAKRSRYLMLHCSCKKLALLATVPPLCGYALLAGAQTPVLRSLIMVLVFILAFCVQRRRSPFTTLSFAALLILLLNPLSLLTVSFQLSFAAVAALILILPRLSSLLEQEERVNDDRGRAYVSKTLRLIAAAFLVSVAATLGTAPLLLHSFNRISTVGPVANLFIEPLLCLWSLPLGLLSIITLPMDPVYGGWFLQAGSVGIKASNELTTFFAGLDFSTLWFANPSAGLIVLYYLSLALCFSAWPRTKTMPLFLFVSALFFFPPQSILAHYSSRSELVFLDVGQGSSTLIHFPGGKKVLIDGGGSSSPRFNVGESVIAPFLWHRGITHLDSIVITHPDSDHCNGIPFLLKRFRPATLWVNGESGQSQVYSDLLDLARELNIQIKQPEKNEVLLHAGGAVLHNISNPFLDTANHSSTSSNAKSLILRFAEEEQGFSCLFPGDIDEQVEKALLDRKSKLKAAILLASHHGSKTSNSPPFLDVIRPQQIVVSAGRFRPLLFPSPQLQSYCREKNIPLLNTAERGAVTVRSGSAGMEFITFKEIL